MVESGSVLRYPGISMTRFGLIPEEYGGGTKYRIIWAPSRMVTLTGREKTVTVPYYVDSIQVVDGIPRQCPAMEPVGDFWILEGWVPPWILAGNLTADEWNANPALLNTGPYPSKGDYIRRETLAVTPADANIEKLITWIEEGTKRTHNERLQACINNMEYDINDRRTKRKDLIGNAMRPFGAETMIGYGGTELSRNSKTYKIVKSAEEVGIRPGETRAMRGGPTYEVPQEA